MVEDCISQQGKIFVAEENQVVGMIAGYVETYNERDELDYTCPKKGIVAELIVSKNIRSKGCGQLLINKVEDYFKSINCEFVQIDVFAYNEIAKNFYHKNNYEERMRKVQRVWEIIYYPFFNNRFIFVQKLIFGLSSSYDVSSTHGKRIL